MAKDNITSELVKITQIIYNDYHKRWLLLNTFDQ